jgi:hypothetical protein
MYGIKRRWRHSFDWIISEAMSSFETYVKRVLNSLYTCELDWVSSGECSVMFLNPMIDHQVASVTLLTR